jgi:hypothetical protein
MPVGKQHPEYGNVEEVSSSGDRLNNSIPESTHCTPAGKEASDWALLLPGF